MKWWLLLLPMLSGCESLENRFVYHPTATDPRAVGQLPAPLQDVELQTADGVKIHARWCPHPQSRGCCSTVRATRATLTSAARSCVTSGSRSIDPC